MSLVILDRDGVINHDSDNYIRSPEQWRPIDGSLEAIARLTRGGYRVVVATNQSGIARGYFDVDTLNAIHNHMLDAIRRKGGSISAIAFCPHAPTDYCECRKPKPGLLLSLAERLKTSLTNVPFVGDSLSDLQAARAAGALPVMVLSGKNEFELTKHQSIPTEGFESTPVYDSLGSFVNHLLSQPSPTRPSHPA